jgi:glycosyltransferase involved in cell wall biosynthesis
MGPGRGRRVGAVGADLRASLRDTRGASRFARVRMAVAILRGSRDAVKRRPRDDSGETAPRGHVFDEMFAPRYDESILDLAAGWRSALSGRVPPWLELALEVHRRRDEYDVIVTWGERLSLALMAVQRLSGQGKPHVPMMYWFSKPNVRLPMRAFGASAHAIVTWSSVQHAYAQEELGIPAWKLHLVKHFVDQRFWRPRERDTDLVCAAGKEMRDYDTLLAALGGTGLRCHLAADHVRVPGLGLHHARIGTERLKERAGADVTVGPLTPTEMRELYARSRFVVVPLRPSDTDNGINVILEAMAMGKAVICSRTRGQVDVLEDGVTGLYVPVGDPAALRAAMLSLWNDPARARAMGARGRAHVERHHTLERFCADVRTAVRSSLGLGAELASPAPIAARGDAAAETGGPAAG